MSKCNYVKNEKNEVINSIIAPTIRRAKKEALEQACYKGGSMKLYFNNSCYYAEMVERVNSQGITCFRWKRWKKIY